MSSTGAEMIVVDIPVTADGARGVEYTWAVRPPVDEVEISTPAGWSPARFSQPFKIEGSPDVVVFNKADTDALRRLLDRIDDVFDEEAGETDD